MLRVGIYYKKRKESNCFTDSFNFPFLLGRSDRCAGI